LLSPLNFWTLYTPLSVLPMETKTATLSGPDTSLVLEQQWSITTFTQVSHTTWPPKDWTSCKWLPK
jgi:hypothetical protein